MSDKERLVRFELLGQEYKFYTAASEEEMRSILSLVRQLVETGPSQSTGTLPVSRIAILACLNITSRYVKLKQEYEGYKQDTDAKIEKLGDKIRATLIVD